MKRNAHTSHRTKKKLSKSTKTYIYCGLGASVFLIILLIIYAAVAKIDIAQFLVSKYACFAYLAIGILGTVGIVLYVKDKISRI